MSAPMERVGIVLAALVALAALAACAHTDAPRLLQDDMREEIYVLRSIHDQQPTTSSWCAASRTGFEPLATDAERAFSFWSVQSRPQDGRIVDAHRKRVAELRGCFGATSEAARQNFYAEIQLAGMTFHGKGECLALLLDFPEPGLYPVRCQLVLDGFPAPFIGGLLTTSTMSSRASFGADTQPPGYTQASIATLRLWKTRTNP